MKEKPDEFNVFWMQFWVRWRGSDGLLTHNGRLSDFSGVVYLLETVVGQPCKKRTTKLLYFKHLLVLRFVDTDVTCLFNETDNLYYINNFYNRL